MIQPRFAALAEEAQRGWVRRVFLEGMVYQGGELHGMTAEAALDASGSYVFVVRTPTHRFGLAVSLGVQSVIGAGAAGQSRVQQCPKCFNHGHRL
jgi:hypothetical protein